MLFEVGPNIAYENIFDNVVHKSSPISYCMTLKFSKEMFEISTRTPISVLQHKFLCLLEFELHQQDQSKERKCYHDLQGPNPWSKYIRSKILLFQKALVDFHIHVGYMSKRRSNAKVRNVNE